MKNTKRWSGPYTREGTEQYNKPIYYYSSNIEIYNKNSANRTNIVLWRPCKKYHILSWRPAYEAMPEWWKTDTCPQCQNKVYEHGMKTGKHCYCQPGILFSYGCQCGGE